MARLQREKGILFNEGLLVLLLHFLIESALESTELGICHCPHVTVRSGLRVAGRRGTDLGEPEGHTEPGLHTCSPPAVP